MPDWKNIIMPPAIAALPKDARGFPVPAFVYTPDGWESGQPLDMRVVDVDTLLSQARGRRCGVCGLPVGYRMWFVGGPMCLNNRIFESPLHRECAEFSLRYCPHLSRSGAEYSSRPSTATVKDHNLLRERPPYQVLVCARGYAILERDPDTGRSLPKPLLKIDPWTACEWLNDDGTPTEDTYAIITNPAGTALYCFACISKGFRAISFNPHDVEHRYCAGCKTFLENQHERANVDLSRS